MVLGEPICHPFTRQVIWTSGTTLTEQHIELLKKMELRAIMVIDLQHKPAGLSLDGPTRPSPPAAPRPEATRSIPKAEAPPAPKASPQAPAAPLRFTRPAAAHGASAAGTARPARPAVGTPQQQPSAQGVQFKPQVIRNEVLERNVQTIKHIQDQVRQSTRLDIQSVDLSVQQTIQRIVTNKELLNSLIDLRVYDEYTYAHSSNVMSLALVVGTAMDEWA